MDNNVNLASLLLQIISLDILFKDCNNSDLMGELQHQNKDYLEKIIEQNKEIIKFLKERSDNNGR
jgi:hypothetical protein